MPPRTRARVPLYHQVLTTLQRRIVDGVYARGERLAAEDVLAAEFGVSRATVRQAVGELVRAGLLTRQQGRGTFVLDVPTPLAEPFRGNVGDLVAAGHAGRAAVHRLSVEHGVAVAARIRDRLALSGATATVVHRARSMDGAPLGLMIDHLPPAIGERLSAGELRATGLMELLEAKGVRIGAAVQTIRAQIADPVVAEALELPLGAPVLAIERVLLEEDGAPVDLVLGWYRGDRYAYTVALDHTGERVAEAV